MKTLTSTLSFLLIFLASNNSLLAQELTDKTVVLDSINIVYENFKTVDRAFVLSHIPISEGGSFNRFISDQSLRSLYNTNYFEFVDFRVTNIDNETVLNIHLTAKYRIKQIEFLGNKNFTTDRLLEEGGISSETILDEYKIDSAARKMSKLYAEEGFNDVDVAYEINRNIVNGDASIKFKISESQKIILKSLSFLGAKTFNSKILRRIIETKSVNLLSWATGSGSFDQTIFLDDLDKLRLFYQNSGFLDVQINPDLISYDFSNPKKANITINIDEGERYSLGSFKIDGATIYTSKELLQFLDIKNKEKEFYSPFNVDKWVKNIEEFYSSRGYLETRVLAQKKSNLNNRRIDILLKVIESEKYYLESISIEGNVKTQQKVIIRELALNPGDVFDFRRMKSSEKRLKNTGFFDEVRLSPEDSSIPARKNLNILVSESKTGSFSFGAGFGSVRSTQFFLEMKQSNFDIGDWESGFQGAGQKFRARLSIGSRGNQVLVGFEEPWLFDQRLSFGTSLYSTEAEYNSSEYNEKRTGIEFNIRRRLFELLEANFSYTYETVDVFDVMLPRDINEPDTIPDVFQEAVGEQSVSKLGLTLLRDNRDSLLFTRMGNRTSINTEFAGLGGDVNYFKVDIRTAQFIPTIDIWKQSLSTIARLGVIVPLKDDKNAPFYDRFFLGGPETLRGYEYRDIGPRSKDGINNFVNESEGGHTYGMISLEYLFQISDGFGFVFFYDGGFVNKNQKDFNLDAYADNYGFGARLLMMGSPLKLDYGIPLNSPDHLSNSPQFHFSFGTRY